ncbi:MAG: flavin reductase family protein [Vampirovibrionales bacterium]
MIHIDPETLDNKARYKLLIGSVVPRPIAFVSTVNRQGQTNLAPFSFFTACGSSPMRVCFVPMIRSSDGQKKDTLRNIEATKEFVVHVVSESFVRQMSQTAGEYPPDISEFDEAGLTPVPSTVVKPPRVAEALVAMECRLHQLVELGDAVGHGTIVVGDVVALHFDESVLDEAEGKVRLDVLSPIGRLAGNSYCRITDTFDIARP